MKKNKYRAVVLAAGPGSRLNEITRHMPKIMIEVNGKHIYEYIIEALAKCGFQEVVFVVGYKHCEITPVIRKKCNSSGIKPAFVVNHKYQETNTMYSLWLAKKYLERSFIFLHGDLLFAYPMMSEFIESPSKNAILVDKAFPSDWDDAMKVITHNNEIKYMSKAITVSEMDGVAIGIYKFSKKGANKLFDTVETLIKRDIKKSWISEAINIMAKTVKISVDENKNYPWVDVDNLTDLEMAKSICKEIGKKSCAASSEF